MSEILSSVPVAGFSGHHTLHCTNWPTTFDYGCQNEEGDDWTLLSKSVNTTDECEILCLKHASDVGCCSVFPGYECYWKGGATVMNATSSNSSLAVACTYNEPGMHYSISPTNSDNDLNSILEYLIL